MLQEEKLSNNVAQISGEIISEALFSHKVMSEGFYNFQIAVKRLSKNFDILPVTVSERLVDKSKLKEGAKIRINGQLRSYNEFYNKKNRLVLTIFAREVEFMEEPLDQEEAGTDFKEKNPNELFLNGFICKAPVYRVTPFGREICDLLVAVNRAYNKSDYIPVIAWGRNARFAGDLKVGENVKLWGRIQSRAYQKRQGEAVEEKTAYEVSVTRMELAKQKEEEEDF